MNISQHGFGLADGSLPRVIAFLRETRVAQARLDLPTLLWGAREAGRLGVGPDEVLIKSGAISERSFYRALAAHLGLRFAERVAVLPLPQGAGPDEILRCANAGLVRLRQPAPRPGAAPEPVFALAPFGASLHRIITLGLAGRSDLVVTTPSELLAGLRQANAGWIQGQANGKGAGVPRRLSAAQGLSAGQYVAAACLAAVLPFSATLDLTHTLVILALMAGPLFVMLITLRLAASLAACSDLAGGGSGAGAPEDRYLPVYSVIVPLYKEARVLPRLLDAIEALDYPKAKLDVKIVVEHDDRETRAALATLARPAHVDVVVVPPGTPRTKPRALNAALLEARGTLVTIFDAEDVPDPQQLRKAVARFAECDPSVMCLQAHLVIDNLADNWVSRCFALEYAALFDVVNPGLLAVDLPILLGGTSNHFQTDRLVAIGGWDAWNVTEDADLSFRMARAGFRTAELASWTYEEAPSDLGIWMRQRTRWLKGYMQTLATHSRHPLRLLREAGAGDALTLLALVLVTIVSSLGYPFFLAGVAHAFLSDGFWQSSSAAEVVVKALSALLFGAGVFSMVLPALLGAQRRGLVRLWLMLPLLPFYYLLVSLAAWRALYELVVSPFHWNKTDHGLARSSHYGAGTSGALRPRALD